MQFKTIDEVWQAIDAGKEVFWGNKSYHLTVEHIYTDWHRREGFKIPYSTRGNKFLRVTCISNYFGSLLEESELGNLFTD